MANLSPDESGWPRCQSIHEWYAMHHYDDDLNHYCPTGYKQCGECGLVEQKQEPVFIRCIKWKGQ